MQSPAMTWCGRGAGDRTRGDGRSGTPWEAVGKRPAARRPGRADVDAEPPQRCIWPDRLPAHDV